MIPFEIAYPEFLSALEGVRAGWTLTETGIVGPEGVSIILDRRHGAECDSHFDVHFALEGRRRDVSLWDCVVGPDESVASAAHVWAQTTGHACLELAYSLRGEFADHYQANDPRGFTGWHTIQGPIMGYGLGTSPAALQQWWLNNPVLPAIAEAVAGRLRDEDGPHGMKIFFGGDRFAEVRINGECDEAASDALLTLGWPTLDPAGFVRSYAILLHEDQ